MITRRSRNVASIKLLPLLALRSWLPLSSSHRDAGRRAAGPRRRGPINRFPPPEPKLVAVVDGDPAIRLASAQLLAAFGFGAATFVSIVPFLAATAARRAACLLIDIRIDGTSGTDLARRLLEAGCRCPIIFTSALADAAVRSEAAAAGAIACLGKPFPADLLIETVIKAAG
jgi:FixJ family two-component response regulator